MIHASDEDVAQAAHEINRAYCEALGDHSQKPWAEAPEDQRDSAVNGVRFHRANPNANPRESHENWLKVKRGEGWRWGMEKDSDLKLHPCCVEYERLPQEQRAKDYIFRAVVHALTVWTPKATVSA
jgi:hypothetical protein